MFQNIEIIPFHSDNGEFEHVCICVHDATIQASQQQQLVIAKEKIKEEHSEQVLLVKKLEETQAQLVQSEKMASIGQLSAGIAHEINNPIGFLNSNLQTLKVYTEDLLTAISKIESAFQNEGNSSSVIQAILNEHQIPFLKEDLHDLVSESLEGTSRVMDIVKNLKEFSHVDRSEWAEIDLIEGIEATINIVKHKLENNIELKTDFEGSIPRLHCQPMQINQVILNILMNSIQAINNKGEILIALKKLDDQIEIKISDTGAGISKDNLGKIFDPFYTTKPVGEGTGLGLSVSYGIIRNHKGSINVSSTLGKGTEFTIKLPLVKL